MKNLILCLAMTTGFAIASSAQCDIDASKSKKQSNLSPTEKADKQSEKMSKTLGLNETQTMNWETALKTRNSLNLPLITKLKGPTTLEERKELHRQMKVNNNNFDNTVSGFLTADQKTKYEVLKKEKQHQRKK